MKYLKISKQLKYFAMAGKTWGCCKCGTPNTGSICCYCDHHRCSNCSSN